MKPPCGLLLVTKPAGITSYDCIRHIKKRLSYSKKVKIGHAGTLDPFAQGLLLISIGREITRLINTDSPFSKTYQATAQLGIATDTLDITGTLLSHVDYPPFSLEQIKKIVESFKGTYEQLPPAYSAIKHQGSTLYTLARNKNKTPEELHHILEAKRRIVHIHDISLHSYQHPLFSLEACVSKGTYIRTLIKDIGNTLSISATTTLLRRTAIGPFHEKHACTLEDLSNEEQIISALIPLSTLAFLIKDYHPKKR